MRAVVFPAVSSDEIRAAAPRISVVVITRDRSEWLRRCLASIAAQTTPPREVIVVDSSEAAESEVVTRSFAGARYLYFPEGRRGMPAARNAGIREARGDVVAFLDDDCEARPDWLERLAAAYAELDVDGVGGKVIDSVVTLGSFRRFLASGEPWADGDDGGSDPADVDFLQGGNMSFRRDVLIAEGFDPAYTGSNYREETDLCFRLRRRGHRLVYVPEAAVTHRRAPRANGIGRAPDDPRREFYHARNQTYFVLKNYGLSARPLAFYLGRQTLEALLAVARRPSRGGFGWLLAHLAGKGAGCLAAARYRLVRAAGGTS